MASLIERMRKRRRYKFTVAGDDTWLRAMTYGEIGIAQQIVEDGNPRSEAASNGYILGVCLINEDGTPCIPRTDNEPNRDFGLRVMTELDPCSDTVAEIVTMVMKLSNGISPAALEKNS